MCPMTDLHCHTLCSVDDGAKNVEQMQEMLDIAYSDGIRTICFTPHFKIHHFRDEEDISRYNEKIKESFALACNYVASSHPDMMLYLGNEIMYHHDIYESIANKRCSRLGSSSYSLVEFSPDTPFFEIKTALLNLTRKGVRPVLAHIERYADVSKNVERARELKELGVLIQVNASSITRLKFGKGARFVKKLFKASLVDIIATDAHDNDGFKPIMSKAFSTIEKKYGTNVARRVSQEIPNLILENKNIY